MIYTNSQIAAKADTYAYKVSLLAKANSIGTKVGGRTLYDEAECIRLLSLLNGQKIKDMEFVQQKLIEYAPIKRLPLAHKCNMNWDKFNRILADLTFFDANVCEDDRCFLHYIKK